MKCLILAAGYATRLYPLTENFPKPLLNVGEKVILDWLIDQAEQMELKIPLSKKEEQELLERWGMK